MVKTQRHRATKAQRKPASNYFCSPAFLVPLRLCVLVFTNNVTAVPPQPHRVAVMDFENITHERALDWIGTGIAETLSSDLAGNPNFRLIERRRLNEAMKEIKLGRSEYVAPS